MLLKAIFAKAYSLPGKKCKMVQNILSVFHVDELIKIKEIAVGVDVNENFNACGHMNGALHSAFLKLSWHNEASMYRNYLMSHGYFDVTESIKDYIYLSHRNNETILRLLLNHCIDTKRLYYELHEQEKQKFSLLNTFATNRSCYKYLETLYIHHLINTNQSSVRNVLLCAIRSTTGLAKGCCVLKENINLLFVAGEIFGPLKQKEDHVCGIEDGLQYRKWDDIICPFLGVNMKQSCLLRQNDETSFPPCLQQIAREQIRKHLRRVNVHVNMFDAIASFDRLIPVAMCRYLLYDYLDEEEFDVFLNEYFNKKREKQC